MKCEEPAAAEAGGPSAQAQNLPEERPTRGQQRQSLPNRVAGDEEELERQIVRVVQQRLFSGPLPPAEELVKYNQAFPECAKLIVERAQKEQSHRHELERGEMQLEQRGLELDNKQIRRGQIIAAILVLVLFIGSFDLLAHDKSISGLSVFSVTIAAIASAFIYDRWRRAKQAGENGDDEDASVED